MPNLANGRENVQTSFVTYEVRLMVKQYTNINNCYTSRMTVSSEAMFDVVGNQEVSAFDSMGMSMTSRHVGTYHFGISG